MRSEVGRYLITEGAFVVRDERPETRRLARPSIIMAVGAPLDWKKHEVKTEHSFSTRSCGSTCYLPPL